MKDDEGLPFVKFMMLLTSMAPLFILVGIRGMDSIISYEHLWFVIGLIVIIPYLVLEARLYYAKKRNDTYTLSITGIKNNKEYLFTFLFTVLIPLYSISITNTKDFTAVVFAICFVIFVLWNLNLHFINVFFALQGYRVYTIENHRSLVLLSPRHSIPSTLTEIRAHRISNSVYIELKHFDYGNR